jgi:hypothetical protein
MVEDDLWKGVIVFPARNPPPDRSPWLRDMNRMIAGPGGFLGRQSDGEPGTQIVWRGLRRAGAIAIAFREAYTLPACDETGRGLGQSRMLTMDGTGIVACTTRDFGQRSGLGQTKQMPVPAPLC